MLQATLHKKLKASFADPSFRPSEDTLTSSVVGLLQYLPSGLFMEILREACGAAGTFPGDMGEVTDVKFWERCETREPDVIVTTDNYHLIIEAKRSDDPLQYAEQWQWEVETFVRSFDDNDREIILLALGGNASHGDTSVTVDGRRYAVYRASWFGLLHAVTRQTRLDHPPHVGRLLADVVSAFGLHGFFEMTWLSSLRPCHLSSDSVRTFLHRGAFSPFYQPLTPLTSTTLINLYDN